MPAFDLAQLAVRIGLALVFVGMGIAHFRPGPARTMAAMIPTVLVRPGLPSARVLVAATGLCEVAGGIGLLIPATRLAAGIALVLFLVAVFPANALAAADPERFGRVAVPFWPRYWAQLVLIALCLFAIL